MPTPYVDLSLRQFSYMYWSDFDVSRRPLRPADYLAFRERVGFQRNLIAEVLMKSLKCIS